MWDDCLGPIMFVGGFLFFVYVVYRLIKNKNKKNIIQLWSRWRLVMWVVSWFIAASIASIVSMLIPVFHVLIPLFIISCLLFFVWAYLRVKSKSLCWEWLLCLTPFNLGFAILMILLQIGETIKVSIAKNESEVD